MYNLALCYQHGKGTEKDLQKASYWCQKAAENGNEVAMYKLTLGSGIGIDSEKIEIT